MKTRADVAKLMDQIFRECQSTREAGQKEYAHDDANALSNFERSAQEIQIPREKSWYIYAKKHWDGITAWINGHRSQREDVRGRIKDMIVYLVLLWAMVDDNEAVKASGGAGGSSQANSVYRRKGEPHSPNCVLDTDHDYNCVSPTVLKE